VVVERILAKTGRRRRQLIGDADAAALAEPEGLHRRAFGVPTVQDILAELEKPGRDPRPEFKTADVPAKASRTHRPAAPGMCSRRRVTNVTAFGAFVDIGVHQDGLVHVSSSATSSSRTRARS
jgi:uncharacterized protein